MTHVTKDADSSTGTCAIHVDRNGDNAIIIAPQANMCLTKRDIDAASDLIKNADVFLTQMETNFDVIKYALGIVKQNGVTGVLNPAPANDIDKDVFRNVDYITPNETEVEFFTGIYRKDYSLEDWFEKCSGRFLEMGVRNVIITLGEKGAGFRSKDSVLICPAYKVNAVDSTAAGDAFNGAFAYAMALDMDIGQAMGIACAAGAICASREGAQTSIGYKEEIFGLLEKAK